MGKVTSWSCFGFLAVALSCGPNIPTEARAPVVSVIYDPAHGNLPTPNDLALVDGKVAIAANPALGDAENALKAGFNGRPGFSAGSTARVQFSGPLSAASLSALSALAFDLGLEGKGPAVEAAMDRVWGECDRSLTLSSPTGLKPGHTYLLALRGGAEGLRGAAGESVVESPAFHFLRAGQDLRAHLEAMPGASRAEKLATATRLEQVRLSLEPHLLLLESKGVPRREVIALWHFTVHAEGEVLFDPARKAIPFPNQLLIDAATGKISLPADPADKPEQLALKHGFNQLDGFSTTAALIVKATAPVDRATVGPATARLFGPAGEFTDLDRTLSADGLELTLQPKSPLLPATRYVVVLTGLKDHQGRPLGMMPLPSVLSLGQSLLDAAGHSTLSLLCDDAAARLEPIRETIALTLASAKLPRDAVNAAWVFTTLDLVGRARELWQTPYEKNLPLQVSGVTVAAAPLVQPNVGKYVTGRLTTWNRLEPIARAFRENGSGAPGEIEFLLTLPKAIPAGGKVPVVIFGHGLNTERRLLFFLADRLGRAGFAAMAIDLPYHGERTACVQDNQCAGGATCAKDGSCLKGGQKGELARGPAYPGLGGPGTPLATGGAFVDVANLFGTRDHFRQALIDLSAQVRLIRGLDWKPVTGGVGLDPDAVHYAGISLGGIIGGELAGVEPYLKSMLLNVGGAGMVDLMRDSATFGPTLKQGLADKGIVENTPAYVQFVNAARWALDEIDPINLAPLAVSRPLQYRDPKTSAEVTAPPKRLRLQMAIGDTVVPNTATQRLVKATAVDASTQFRSFLGSHGFLADPIEPACYVGQDDLVSFLEGP